MYKQMCRLVIKETKQAPIRDVREFMEMIGPYFVDNHRWKVHVREATKPTRFTTVTLVTGQELAALLKEDMQFICASFSALEGDQILFSITCGSEWVIHTTRKHWVEFFEEKCKIAEKTLLDPDLPEFAEFMQD